MAIVWGVGGLLVGLGALLVVVSILRRSTAAESQRLAVVAGLVMTGLGVVAISAAALASGDDDADDDRVAAGAETTEPGASGSSDGKGAGGGEDGADGDREDPAADDSADGSGSGSAGGGGELPACFEQYLAAEPTVAEDDHVRLDEGVNRQVILVGYSTTAIALELVDGDELLGVMRIGDRAMPVGDILNIYDVVDGSCQPVAFTPQESDDPVGESHQTVVPLDLGGQRYEVTFVQHGISPELDVVLRQAS